MTLARMGGGGGGRGEGRHLSYDDDPSVCHGCGQYISVCPLGLLRVEFHETRTVVNLGTPYTSLIGCHVGHFCQFANLPFCQIALLPF